MGLSNGAPSFQWVTSGMRAIGGNGGDRGIPSTARYMSDGTRVGQWGCDCRAQTETTPTVVVPALCLSFCLINDFKIFVVPCGAVPGARTKFA